MKRNLIISIFVALGVMLVSSNAFAYSLGSNQTADLGSTGFYMTLVGTSGAQAGKNYSITFNTNGTAKFGSINNGRFDSVIFDSLLSSATVQEYVGGAYTPIAGNLTGQLQLGYHNVNVNTGTNQAALVGGTGSGAGLALNVSGTIGGSAVQFTSALSPNFMDFTLGSFAGAYDGAVSNFGTNGVVNSALTIDGSGSSVHGWVTGGSQVFFNGVGNAFTLSADLHSSLNAAAVPEPASMLLLSGALGAAGLRRKRKAA